jgi:hypothetical protein
VISGYDKDHANANANEDWKSLIPEMLKNGMSVRDITEELLQNVKNVKKNEIKDAVLALKVKHFS